MNDDKRTRRPLLEPLLLALKSRRVIVALCALLVGVLLLSVPALTPLRAEITTLIVALALAVIAGYSLADAVNAGREHAALPITELRDLIREVIDALLDETAGEGSK